MAFNENRKSGVGSRAGVLGPKTKIVNTQKAKEISLQKTSAKGGSKEAPNSGPGGNVKKFGQGKATDNRSARKGN